MVLRNKLPLYFLSLCLSFAMLKTEKVFALSENSLSPADSTGKYSFLIPESRTTGRWMSQVHANNSTFGSNGASITQKKLMVQANPPRFMCEGDNIEFSAKISNLTDKEITGQVMLQLFDAATNTSVDGWFQNIFPSQYFTVEAGQHFAVKFPIQIPYNFNKLLGWRLVAKSGDMSDAEENRLPVVTNRVLVTETLPLFLVNDSTRHFRFNKLVDNRSESLTNQALTLEYTANPVWFAVQALPYLIDYPYECAEQRFNRFFANTLASLIVKKQPVIQQVFEQWKKDSTALMNSLQKNQELKQMLLQETPWVLEAEDENTQRRNIAMLFDLGLLAAQSEDFIEKLVQLQLPNGSFSWFKGGAEDRYMTNYIVTGIGKLKKLDALTPEIIKRINPLLTNAIRYLDGKIQEDYVQLLKSKIDTSAQHVMSTQIDYLYMRSFFKEIPVSIAAASRYYYRQGKRYWIRLNNYYRAELGLVYYRSNEAHFTRTTLLPSILGNAVHDQKLGMYWKATYTGFWYQSTIEYQSMMIALISELEKGQKNAPLTSQLNAMKTWLMLNKQTTHWKTTIATADACYALLLNNTDWLNTDKKVHTQLGNYAINSSDEKTETGSGYFKKRIEGRMLSPEMGNITVTTTTNTPANQQPSQPTWGSIYWQYFEDLDKITPTATPLSVTKKLLIERNTNTGKTLELIKDGHELKTGDKVLIRMTLKSDRAMDYLQLKDMRAATMEPVTVLSGYQWHGAQGYFESTNDLSSNFFISHLDKGTYVFEYPVFIKHTGVFSSGIATVQCMYAPVFTSHSEGIKIRVAN